MNITLESKLKEVREHIGKHERASENVTIKGFIKKLDVVDAILTEFPGSDDHKYYAEPTICQARSLVRMLNGCDEESIRIVRRDMSFIEVPDETRLEINGQRFRAMRLVMNLPDEDKLKVKLVDALNRAERASEEKAQGINGRPSQAIDYSEVNSLLDSVELPRNTEGRERLRKELNERNQLGFGNPPVATHYSESNNLLYGTVFSNRKMDELAIKEKIAKEGQNLVAVAEPSPGLRRSNLSWMVGHHNMHFNNGHSDSIGRPCPPSFTLLENRVHAYIPGYMDSRKYGPVKYEIPINNGNRAVVALSEQGNLDISSPKAIQQYANSLISFGQYQELMLDILEENAAKGIPGIAIYLSKNAYPYYPSHFEPEIQFIDQAVPNLSMEQIMLPVGDNFGKLVELYKKTRESDRFEALLRVRSMLDTVMLNVLLQLMKARENIENFKSRVRTSAVEADAILWGIDMLNIHIGSEKDGTAVALSEFLIATDHRGKPVADIELRKKLVGELLTQTTSDGTRIISHIVSNPNFAPEAKEILELGNVPVEYPVEVGSNAIVKVGGPYV